MIYVMLCWTGILNIYMNMKLEYVKNSYVIFLWLNKPNGV
jgi:hypothetical protein